MDLQIKYKYFKEWLDNTDSNFIPPNLKSSIEKLQFDENNNLIPSSVDSIVNSAMLAIIGNHLTEPFFDGKTLSEYKSLLQKENYFEQQLIENIEDFDSFYNKYSNSRQIIFRGVKEAKWRLYNSLQRFWITSEKEDNIDSYKTFIRNLIENAKIENNALLSNFLIKNNINPDNDVAILSFLQHYSGPTPMLDWTYNLAYALFFASNDITNSNKSDIDNYISIYLLEEEHIKDTSLRKIAENVLKSYEDKIRTETIKNAKKEGITERELNKFFSPYRLELTAKFMYGKLAITGACRLDSIFIYPITYFSDIDEDTPDLIPFSLNNNLNIVNQNGVFIFNNHPTDSLEEVGKNMHVSNGGEISNYRFCKCYNIHKKLVPHILEKLISQNISKETIYPDPTYFVAKIFEKTNKI